MMRVYDGVSTCGKMSVTIFARSNRAAAGIFFDLFVHRYGVVPSYTIVSRPKMDERDPDALNKALQRGVSGIGMYSDGEWTIEPVEACIQKRLRDRLH
ncbi:hypothetical protein [Sphingobium sp. WCS2017Hpa-17]|uniref:hypothetical protein n=1 Tax=Sphingobium sp. WCS2017Hpa-17 TaxID=3073638 RepID=UPI0028894F91|nr:hypothetical protein [Sphingobium sp. WCS2017Hpa-17]